MSDYLPEDQIAISQGTYWKALQDIGNEDIVVGDVLLLQSIRDVDGQPHTIILRPHPKHYGWQIEREHIDADGNIITRYERLNEHRFLVQDFLKYFVEEPNYVTIRQAEIGLIQGRLLVLQRDISQAATGESRDLQERIDAGLLGWEKGKNLLPGSTSDIQLPKSALMTLGLTVSDVDEWKLAAERTSQIATIHSTFIEDKVKEIGEVTAEMTPYFKEQAVAALAKTEDVRTYVKKLTTSIESLDLYVGTGVDVWTASEGKGADPSIPLTIVQQKLFANEELSVFAEVGEEFDYTNEKQFFDALVKYPDFRSQVFPTDRCIVSYATRRNGKDYGDPFINEGKNAINLQVGLLIRNGENIHVVVSPVTSHQGAANLFPSRADMDNIFQDKEFYGQKPRTITFMDVKYTDKLTQFEARALHYKRFMILLAGLDHRLNLFGTFYTGPKTLAFISQAFQQEHFRFIRDEDGEGMLPKPKKMELGGWISLKNKGLKSGSRVACMWGSVMNPETAPGACKATGKYSGYVSFSYSPVDKMGVVIASRSGKEIVVQTPVSGYSYSTHGNREFNCKVNLSKFSMNAYRNTGFGYLVIDDINPEELEAYIYDRDARVGHLDYIQFFKLVVNYLRQERQAQHFTRNLMIQDVMNLPEVEDAEGIVDRTIIAWRSANRGACLPTDTSLTNPEWISLLDQMYLLVNSHKDVTAAEALARTKSVEPLRLVLTGKNKLILYCKAEDGEIDESLLPFVWVRAFTLTRSKAGLKEVGCKWDTLPANAASETTIHEWPLASEWAGKSSVTTHAEYSDMKNAVVGAWKDEKLPVLLRESLTVEEWTEAFSAWNRARMLLKGGDKVSNPSYIVPIGIALFDQDGDSGLGIRGIYLYISYPEERLYDLAPTMELKNQWADTFPNRYLHAKDRRHELTDSTKRYTQCSVYYCTYAKAPIEGFTGYKHFKLTATQAKGSALPLQYGLKKGFEFARKLVEEGTRYWGSYTNFMVNETALDLLDPFFEATEEYKEPNRNRRRDVPEVLEPITSEEETEDVLGEETGYEGNVEEE